MQPNKKLLIINAGEFQNTTNVNATKTKHLSKFYYGDLIHNIYDKKYRNFVTDSFKVSGIYIPKIFRKIKPLKNIYYVLATIIFAIKENRKEHKYQAIIARSPLLPGFMGILVKFFIKTPLIIEMNGNYANPIVWHEGNPSRIASIKHFLAMRIVPFTVNRADKVRLLYPEQLQPYGKTIRLKMPTTIMHEFVKLDEISPSSSDDGYILFLGSPWYIKGIDILIDAFNLVSKELPEAKLKIIAWLPNESKKLMSERAAGNKNIEICLPVWHDEAQEAIKKCKFLVLPSRTEGMGRVLLESMAHRKTVIGANVEGIPHYIDDGKNGFIFEKENVQDLKDKITTLLKQPEMMQEMATYGYEYAKSHYGESAYITKYREMIESTIQE